MIDACNELGYVRNGLLRSSVPDDKVLVAITPTLSNLYYVHMVEAMQRRAKELGYVLLAFDTFREIPQETRIMQVCNQFPFAGVCFLYPLENNMLMQERYELQELRDLYNLDSDYSDLNKIAANVIGKDTGNWFNMFIIDKGSSDGIKVDMNVIAGGGLVGIVTKTGPDWAQVRSIIDDMSNVSAMILKNSDLCYVRGDLEMMSEGTLQLNQLRDQNDEVESGDKVVTSYASAKYHKGILIGYVNELAVDSNNLTKSGSITPAVDFEHLSTVLVITDLKQQVDESQADATEEDTLLDETTETE